MRLTARKRLTLTTVASTIVLVTALTTAGRGDLGDAPAEAIALDSHAAGAGTAPVTAQAIRVPAIPVVQARVRDTKGTPKLPPSAFTNLDIPATALVAYQRAAAVMEQASASCGLSWTLLAAIGRIESNHGRFGGATLRPDGTSSPPIRGVALDGRGALARIHDTDAGQLDGDTVWDRAVGPMQFLPSTWSVVGVDADGDGSRSPDDIDDAALAAAVFLCAAPGTLDTDRGRRTAVFRYNPSNSYVASVLALDRAYRSGKYASPWSAQALTVQVVVGAPSGIPGTGTGLGTAPAGGGGSHHAIRAGADPTTHPTAGSTPSAPGSPGSPGTPGSSGTPGTPGSTPSSTPVKGSNGPPGPTDTTPGTGTPAPTPTPSPSPTPPPPSSTPDPPPTPAPDQLTGILTACGTDQWCLGDLPLIVGDATFLAATATSDYDADGTVESNADELTGLTGTQVTLSTTPGTAPAVVVAINGLAYG